jgi:hypothetical protein
MSGGDFNQPPCCYRRHRDRRANQVRRFCLFCRLRGPTSLRALILNPRIQFHRVEQEHLTNPEAWHLPLSHLTVDSGLRDVQIVGNFFRGDVLAVAHENVVLIFLVGQ